MFNISLNFIHRSRKLTLGYFVFTGHLKSQVYSLKTFLFLTGKRIKFLRRCNTCFWKKLSTSRNLVEFLFVCSRSLYDYLFCDGIISVQRILKKFFSFCVINYFMLLYFLNILWRNFPTGLNYYKEKIELWYEHPFMKNWRSNKNESLRPKFWLQIWQWFNNEWSSVISSCYVFQRSSNIQGR